MEVKLRNLTRLFVHPARYEIPRFQRPYIWTRDKQWVPLWDDVQHTAERILAARRGGSPQPQPHFMGAVVLQQIANVSGSLARRFVVDGQQRSVARIARPIVHEPPPPLMEDWAAYLSGEPGQVNGWFRFHDPANPVFSPSPPAGKHACVQVSSSASAQVYSSSGHPRTITVPYQEPCHDEEHDTYPPNLGPRS